MSSITVHLEVPKHVENGLASGKMERVGGVIRYSDNKRIVAWLREGGKIGQVTESSAGLLDDVIRLSGNQQATLGKLLAGAIPILGVAMAGYALLEHIEGIRAHEAEIERIYDRVSEEFQRDREVSLLAALDYAENTFLVNNEEYKRQAVAEVNYDLAVARGQLIEDLDKLLSAEMNAANMDLAMNYQVLAMRVCAMGTRLRLEIGEDEAAIDWLSKCVSGHKSRARSFVKRWIGSRTALFFHESVNDEYLERYLDIERWLRERQDVLKEVISENRRDFWKDEAVSALYTRGINRRLEENPYYVKSLDRAEILIENFQRLQGYELELKSMRSPFKEWEALNSALIEKHDGYVMLVSDEQSEVANESSS